MSCLRNERTRKMSQGIRNSYSIIDQVLVTSAALIPQTHESESKAKPCTS